MNRCYRKVDLKYETLLDLSGAVLGVQAGSSAKDAPMRPRSSGLAHEVAEYDTKYRA